MSEYHSNKIMVYLPTSEVQKILGMSKKTDEFLDEYQVKVRKRGDNTLVLVEVLDTAVLGDLEEGIAQVRSRLYDHLTDKESIERVLDVLSISPESGYFQDVLSDLQNGDPLSYRVDEILSEIEERKENPDPNVLSLIESAKSKQPNSRFIKSLEGQFRGGFDLSEGQISALEKIVTPVINQGQLDLVDNALSSQPNSRFLKQLKSVLEGGRSLSQKQLDVVDKILNPQQQSSPSSSDPQTRLLEDLSANGRYLTRDDYLVIRNALKGGKLDEEQRKRLRHLTYKNSRRLQNTYSRDEVRQILKKASARVVAMFLNKPTLGL
jgi:hypothetical protein